MSVFFDSNVPLYLARHDERKARIAEEALLRGGWISVQVLSEVAHVARRKFGYDWKLAAMLLEDLKALVRVADLTVETQMLGLDVAERYRLSVYDGMIVAAALLAGCDTLYSEDMHAGLVVDGRLTIVNPFA